MAWGGELLKPKSDRRSTATSQGVDARRSDGQPLVEDRRGSDRRTHERVTVDIEVDYRATDTFLFAYITDISAMGIFVRTETPEPRGTRLNLRFRVSTGEMMEVEGEVIWINPPVTEDTEGRNPGMGVQFRELGAAQREEMLRLVKTFAYLNDENPDDSPGDGGTNLPS
jgi:type IV pilus assembly protein PilZ